MKANITFVIYDKEQANGNFSDHYDNFVALGLNFPY